MPRRKKQPNTAAVPAKDEIVPVAEPQSTKLLGDFTSIRESLTTFKPFHNLLRSDCPGDGAVQLGNLSKILNQLRESNASPDQNGRPVTEYLQATTVLRGDVSKVTGAQRAKHGDVLPLIQQDHPHIARDQDTTPSADIIPKVKQVLSKHEKSGGTGSQSQTTQPKSILKRKPATATSDSDHDSRTLSESNDALTPATTPPTPPNKFKKTVSSKATISKHTQASHDLLSLLREESKHSQDTSHVQPLFSYHISKSSPLSVIWATLRTQAEAHEILGVKLIIQHTNDRITSIGHPRIISNGIHVFLDLSNIEISFQHTLKLRHGLSDSVRFSAAPKLNLEFLNEILTRGRPAHSLYVGCSMKPGDKEPRYVRDLNDLGYHVDLRKRKLDDSDPSEQRARYVEDLVDETLQTRIGEAVMEYHTKQGTIVLATGDAKPAQYSDGFFQYVNRALRMGWNVEVVSWKSSLSEAWRNLNSSGKWGAKFRIIELDDFVDELYACYRKESA